MFIHRKSGLYIDKRIKKTAYLYELIDTKKNPWYNDSNKKQEV